VNEKKIKKIKKNSRTWEITNAVDPAKRALERTRIERGMPYFRPGLSWHCQLTRAD
jgi:hypothetical protein